MPMPTIGPTKAALAGLILVMGGPAAARAQRLAPPYWSRASHTPSLEYGPRPAPPPARSRVGALIVGGLIGGAAGFFTGAYTGGTLGGGNRVCGDDPCGLEGALWGAAAGVTVGLPLGVHVANHRRGSLGEELIASMAAAGVGLAAASATNSGVPLLVVPVAQLSLSIAIEQRESAP
jgi:hypothetical protein